METTCVLITRPMYTYLEEQISTHFKLIKLYNYTSLSHLITSIPNSKSTIKALVVDTRLSDHAKMIELLPNLEIVSTYSVGYDKIDLGKCKEKGIRVTNTPDVLTDDVADLAIGLILSVSRKVCACDEYVRSGKWNICGDFGLTTKFSGKSIGIIGLGRIGLAVAKRVEAFGCHISYHSRSQKPDTTYKYYSDVVTLGTACQILIVSCTLTEETKHIINREVINALGPNGILINIGRGAHVDEPELVSALLEGRLGGAGLDVFENEPEVPEELIGLDNVVLMPHVGSDTVETCNAMANLVVGNLVAHFKNKPLLSPVL
ncbi:hypothetical protein ACFE04_003979 [Oxalis oulophora]